MDAMKNTIEIITKLGGKFAKGFKGKASFISMARSINNSIIYYQNNEPEKILDFESSINNVIETTHNIVIELHDILKKELSQNDIELKDLQQEKETIVINFSIDNEVVKNIILLCLLADEVFAMVTICLDQNNKIISDRKLLSECYQKPVIDSLKNCLDELIKIETKSRKSRKGGLYEKRPNK